MRQAYNPQTNFNGVKIEDIVFDLRDRDEIPQLLMGLQAIFKNPVLRNKVFDILWQILPPGVDTNNGRPGMCLWEILVLGTLRLACNWDYDKVLNIANNHRDVRRMLGKADDDWKPYALQTVKDNLRLFTPEVNDQINQIVVQYGRQVAGNKEGDIQASCDSAVVKTDVHFPTDTNLLLDAVRCLIQLISAMCLAMGLTEWRQGEYHVRKFRRAYRDITRLQKSRAKDPEKVKQQEEKIRQAYIDYLDLAEFYIQRVRTTLTMLLTLEGNFLIVASIAKVEEYLAHAERQIDQIRRRKLEGQRIPHREKVFSIHEPHTDLIIKGKAGVPFELGLNTCVVRDQNGFILFHLVMEKVADRDVAVDMFNQTVSRFGDLESFSCDQGFYSPANYEALKDRVPVLVMPRGGKPTREQQERQARDEHKQARRSHATVESSIHALKNHGLDQCPDHGLDGFKRYVSLAVLARNLQILGRMLRDKELKRLERQQKKNALAEA